MRNEKCVILEMCFFVQKYQTDIKDLEHLGELGNGTCGHVVKMLHKPSNTVIAVKVSIQTCVI